MTENNKGQTIFLSVVGIATLLVAIIGATFAWFSATVSGNDTASSVVVETATIGITYTNGNEIKLQNALPGATDTKTFTVAAAEGSTIDQSYKINWNITTFDFANKADLVYALTGTPDGKGTAVTKTETAMPTTTGVSEIGSGTLKPDETHSYSLKVTFKETGSNQNANQGKHFAGKIEVAAENVSAN